MALGGQETAPTKAAKDRSGLFAFLLAIAIPGAIGFAWGVQGLLGRSDQLQPGRGAVIVAVVSVTAIFLAWLIGAKLGVPFLEAPEYRAPQAPDVILAFSMALFLLGLGCVTLYTEGGFEPFLAMTLGLCFAVATYRKTRVFLASRPLLPASQGEERKVLGSALWFGLIPLFGAPSGWRLLGTVLFVIGNLIFAFWLLRGTAHAPAKESS